MIFLIKFFSLFYCKNTVYNTCNIQTINLLFMLLVINSKLLSFGGVKSDRWIFNWEGGYLP